ncbi:MAG: hypothetical protein EXS12_08200 [Phycisphaerales bacterium]|nr:hypothetical protein [Phycisphaerales bacterium]
MKNYITVMSAIFCVCSISTAQAPSATPPAGQAAGQQNGQPRGPGPGQPGGPVATPASADQIAQLLMRGDKNGDRKLSPEEIPPQIKDRFGSIDTNKDGVIDQEELVAFAKTQDKTGGARRGGQGQNFEGAMKQINRGLKALEKSAVDVDSKAQDLANIQMVEAGIINAKGMISTVKMAPQAKEKYGDDTAKYESDIRSQLLATLTVAMALENAVIRGDSAGAKELIGKLDQEEDEGHEMFKREENEEKQEMSEGGQQGERAPTVPPGAPPSSPTTPPSAPK